MLLSQDHFLQVKEFILFPLISSFFFQNLIKQKEQKENKKYHKIFFKENKENKTSDKAVR